MAFLYKDDTPFIQISYRRDDGMMPEVLYDKIIHHITLHMKGHL